jgi:hypothetical protein
MPSAWIEHVKEFQKANGCSYKQALQQASSTYQKGSGLRNQYDPANPQYHITGGNIKKASKAQLKRLVNALGDKAIHKLSGMGSVGQMLKESAANNVVRLMDSGTNRATGEMEGGNLKKASKKQLIRLVEALGDKTIGKLSGMGSVGQMLKESAANNVVRLMDSGTSRATSEMEGGKISRINKAGKWEQFANSTLRDAVDTAGKAGRVYYDTTSPLAQLGFGLKKHKRLSGRALLAAGYS